MGDTRGLLQEEEACMSVNWSLGWVGADEKILHGQGDIEQVIIVIRTGGCTGCYRVGSVR